MKSKDRKIKSRPNKNKRVAEIVARMVQNPDTGMVGAMTLVNGIALDDQPSLIFSRPPTPEEWDYIAEAMIRGTAGQLTQPGAPLDGASFEVGTRPMTSEERARAVNLSETARRRLDS